MRTIAFLFPGQGSQAVGMGKELAAMYPVARQTFDEADEALGYKISELCFEGPEEKLKLTEVTQPAILTVSVAAFRVLRETGITPNYVAGHSVGEYAAHVAAGTFDFKHAVRVARNRGRYMQEAVPVGEGAMAAILGMNADGVRAACEEASQGEVVQAANNNSPEQVVISGHAAAVQRAADLAKQHGAKKTVMLQVSAPFHCSLLKPAQDRLEADLKQIEFYDPEVPVIANIDAEPRTSASAARQALIRQATGAVQWERSINKLISLGVEVFVEVGPGKVLCGLMRQIDRTKLCLNVQDEASLQKTMNELEPHHNEPG
ncbi:MAG TPA: ACP S-malonyltransferase [Terriglobales bacterium]|nr:ACP S-malonyltransferase [Terriglobales bacterium]